MNIGIYLSANIRVSIFLSSLENFAYEFVLTFSVIPSMSCSSYYDNLGDG